MNCTLATNANGRVIEVDLSIEDAALPYVKIVGSGTEDCAANEWGNNSCREILTSISSAEIVIPIGYVMNETWININSGKPSQKVFNFQKYTECIQWKWDN